jgi:hypothetical protein
LHRKKHEVIDQPDLFLNKRFSVTHACEKAVVPGFGEGPFPYLFLRHEEGSTLRLRGIL